MLNIIKCNILSLKIIFHLCNIWNRKIKNKSEEKDQKYIEEMKEIKENFLFINRTDENNENYMFFKDLIMILTESIQN